SAAATAVAAASASVPFSAASQTVALSATVTSTAGIVNQGTATFTILSGSTAIGNAITVNVVNGAAAANYTLPAGTPGGTYTIRAVYTGTASFPPFTASRHSPALSAAATASAAASASATFSAASHTVALSATVTSTAGTVNEGSV